MRKSTDSLTLDMFAMPVPQAATPGNLDLDVPLRQALCAGLKHAEGDRFQVAAEMSRVTGREISKNMLDAYTAESRQDYNFPMRYAAAFEHATDSYCLTNLLGAARGCRVLVGEDTILAEMVKIERMEADLKRQKKLLQKHLGSGK